MTSTDDKFNTDAVSGDRTLKTNLFFRRQKLFCLKCCYIMKKIEKVLINI